MFEQLGASLTVLRILQRLSQAEVANWAGIKATQVSRYETGQVLPQLPQLERLLVALGVGLPELFYTLIYVERTARVLEQGRSESPESIAMDAMVARWRDVADHHLAVSEQVAEVVEARLRLLDGEGAEGEGES